MLDEYTSKLEAAAPETPVTDEKLFTDEQFAHLGGGTLAYIKAMTSEEVRSVFPNAPVIEPGLKVYALLGADGKPLLLSDSRDMAIANARENSLELMQLQ